MPFEPAPRPLLNCAPALNLEHQRKLAGVSLDQIVAKTKISLRFLKAIEAGEYEKLPGGIFTTSYLRQYAAAIGYDEAVLLQHCDRKMNPERGASDQTQPREHRTRLDRWFGIAAQESR
jgi:cytoskeleton protein RodZ